MFCFFLNRIHSSLSFTLTTHKWSCHIDSLYVTSPPPITLPLNYSVQSLWKLQDVNVNLLRVPPCPPQYANHESCCSYIPWTCMPNFVKHSADKPGNQVGGVERERERNAKNVFTSPLPFSKSSLSGALYLQLPSAQESSTETGATSAWKPYDPTQESELGLAYLDFLTIKNASDGDGRAGRHHWVYMNLCVSHSRASVIWRDTCHAMDWSFWCKWGLRLIQLGTEIWTRDSLLMLVSMRTHKYTEANLCMRVSTEQNLLV